ncbi:MAG: hypothetical protein MAG795_01023 [Candidatus Woesearchaeota archaeon]|nr:hypothetical protein [Candidatus Woesearchaeota archaeon]
MNKYLSNAEDELKRVYHLIHVSLKYTRTVDVLKNVLMRIINCFDSCFLALLTQEKDPENMPKSPGLRTKMLRDQYKEDIEILEFIDFYHHLRKLSRAEFKRSREFRRHVTMTAQLEEGPVEITIDVVTSFYRTLRIFFKLVSKIIGEDDRTIREMLTSAEAEVDFEGK